MKIHKRLPSQARYLLAHLENERERQGERKRQSGKAKRKTKWKSRRKVLQLNASGYIVLYSVCLIVFFFFIFFFSFCIWSLAAFLKFCQGSAPLSQSVHWTRRCAVASSCSFLVLDWLAANATGRALAALCVCLCGRSWQSKEKREIERDMVGEGLAGQQNGMWNEHRVTSRNFNFFYFGHLFVGLCFV